MKRNHKTNKKARYHFKFTMCAALIALLSLGASTAIAEVVILSSVTGTDRNTPTPCPPYCELAGNWAGSTLKSSAPGLLGSRGGSRFETQTAGSFSLSPTLAGTTGTYYVEVTHGSATSISADLVVGITASGATGLPATTDGFQQTKGVNTWYRIGQMTLDGSTASPTITFTYSSGSANRFYTDGFRFINTNTTCLLGAAQLTMVNGPLAAGQTFVNVPAVDGTVTNVSVYAYDPTNSTYTFLGAKTTGIVAGDNAVTTSPLVKGQVIVASQWKSGYESCLVNTGPIVGGGPNPQIRLSLSIRDNAPANHTIGADGGSAGVHLVFIKADGTLGGGFGVAPTGGLALTPGTCWQHIEFNRATDPIFGWSGAYADSYLTNDWATIDAIAFCVEDLQDSGPFGIYIDNFMNGTNLVQNFESATNGEATVLINQPSFSGSTSPYLLAPTPGVISPNISVVVNTNVASGSKCLYMSWQFKDDSNQDWLRATFQGSKTPNPIVDLRQPVSFDVLLLPVGTSHGHFVSVGTLESSIVYLNQNASFTIVPTGPGTFTYQWNVNGADVLDATNATYSVTSAQLGDAGPYIVKVNDGTCTTERSATLTVLNPSPTFTNQPLSATIYLSQTTNFTALADGHTSDGYPLTYQWQLNGGNIQDATNTTIVITNAQHSDEGTYVLTVNNNFGSANSGDAILTVLDPIPTVTNPPSHQTVLVNGTASFSVGADGHVALGYPLSYQWRFNDADLTDETNTLLVIPSAQLANVGGYDVVVANSYGSVTSALAGLDVVTVPPGTGTGLRASYFNNTAYTNNEPPNPFGSAPALTRLDPMVNFDWLVGSPAPQVTTDYFAVVWSGQILPMGADTYTFYTTTDDGVRLWIDGALLIDHWVPQAPTSWTNSIALTQAKHDISIDYYEKTGGAVAKLNWFSSGLTPQPVPTSQLFPTISSPTLGASKQGSSVVFNWTGPFFLQSATNVAGPWSTLYTATSPYTNAIGSEPSKFFRLITQ